MIISALFLHLYFVLHFNEPLITTANKLDVNIKALNISFLTGGQRSTSKSIVWLPSKYVNMVSLSQNMSDLNGTFSLTLFGRFIPQLERFLTLTSSTSILHILYSSITIFLNSSITLQHTCICSPRQSQGECWGWGEAKLTASHVSVLLHVYLPDH